MPSGDYRSGEELYKDVLYYRSILDTEFYVEFVEVGNRSEFFEAIHRVRDTLKVTGQVPLLHLETHGSEEGLILASGDFVTYSELFVPLIEISKLGQNNLWVAVTACYGIHLYKVVDPTDRSPFYGICGPSEKIAAKDVFAGYKAFYEEGLTSSDMNAALEAANNAIPHESGKFGTTTSESLFLLACRYYFAQQCTGAGLEERVKAMLTKFKEDGELDQDKVALMGERYRQRVSGEPGMRKDYDGFCRNFFMHDLYPEAQHLPSPKFERMMQIQFPEQ